MENEGELEEAEKDGEDEVHAAEGQGEADAKFEPSGNLETRWI